MRLLIFNPETDYALASGASFYTPPASVVRLRMQNQLLPESWAQEGDMILVDSKSGLSSSFRLVDWDDLCFLWREYPDLTIDPWGWNPALVRKLYDHGVPPHKLPDVASIGRIRNLSHRKTTIVLNRYWNELAGPYLSVDLPVLLNDEEDCMAFLKKNPGCWMKAPWSSSGRGVINTAADMTEQLVAQWCRGILRRQGCVIGETGANRLYDFATEWRIENGEPSFIGLSSFQTSRRGKYMSNFIRPQSVLADDFNSVSNIKIDEVMALQQDIISHVFKDYEGPLGVDMLLEPGGKLRPFVEVNVRRTMGMIQIIP